ncbi:hypothetical protein N7462_007879 [Penicillium macrosclerotiorum]|uniref:uncharacterized protein n=1 Tax=Penicillium macrosclerotiorum TaxID=303699 RepID=UPI0025470424|nr:uncharacterized protein N7462_007879 [Penicillium macrosclerotiorum]KAJ5679635.1 hypothetical protein N7462_007879 [Penicillium macrosclerotiorum]
MTDFDNAARGFLGTIEPCIIQNTAGRTIWSLTDYAFLSHDCPDTVNPKLWRQGQLTAHHGLFEVSKGIYQVRGFDISNMTIVEGRTGVIIIDPLVSCECAAAAFSLYKKHRGDRPLVGLIYSHSHVDHFGGASGILPEGTENSVPIIAPEGFMEEATSENIYVGPAMRRRARYMYGTSLPKSAEGQVGCGLGLATSQGTTSLVPPNVLVSKTGEEKCVDGIRIIFQMVNGTEAPSEFNFYFPDSEALYISECATHCMHNIITLRGALVRDAKAWSRHLDESIALFGEKASVLFAGHHWPTWGQKGIIRILTEQRDMYAFMHDQTVRLMNEGLNGIEIAEVLKLPSALDNAWHLQGYYGSLSHNIKAIYQRYMTWFDGNPVNLWKHPPTEEAKRYIDCMGGVDRAVKLAENYASNGDLRFAATLLGHAVAAESTHNGARTLLGFVFTKLGQGSLNGTWRNFYLTGAQDMKINQNQNTGSSKMTKPKLDSLLSVEQWLSALSVQIDGPRAADEFLVIDIRVKDLNETWRLILSNGALTYRVLSAQIPASEKAILRLDVTKEELRQILIGEMTPEGKAVHGDAETFQRLLQFFPWGSKSRYNSHL